jgi:hypothetical protein
VSITAVLNGLRRSRGKIVAKASETLWFQTPKHERG